MLRQDASAISSDSVRANRNSSSISGGEATRIGGIDIQRELNKLEEMILDSPRIFLSRRTIVDEEQLLEQLDLVRLNLPSAFQEAADLVRHKEDVLLEAEQYAQEIIESAERRAEQILNEMNLIRQAELEAEQIRQRVQQECQALQDQTMATIEQMRQQAQQEIEEMRQVTLSECEDVQAGADHYADHVLSDLEHQLTEMMRIIRNGRQQLHAGNPSISSRDVGNANSARNSSIRSQDRPRK